MFTDKTEEMVKQFQVAYYQKFEQNPNFSETTEDTMKQYSKLDENGNLVYEKYLPIAYYQASF